MNYLGLWVVVADYVKQHLIIVAIASFQQAVNNYLHHSSAVGHFLFSCLSGNLHVHDIAIGDTQSTSGEVGTPRLDIIVCYLI